MSDNTSSDETSTDAVVDSFPTSPEAARPESDSDADESGDRNEPNAETTLIQDTGVDSSNDEIETIVDDDTVDAQEIQTILLFMQQPSTLRRRAEHISKEQLWHDAETTLINWHRRARYGVFGHHQAASYHSFVNRALGVTVLILTALLTIFRTQVLWHSVLAALAAIFISLQTLLKEGQQAAGHIRAADSYSSVRRKIEAIAGMPRPVRGDVKSTLTEVSHLLDQAARESPPVGDLLWNLGKKKADAQKASALFVDRPNPH